MSDEPIVTVKQGKLRGAIRCNIDGGEYLSFRGIPFAEPPVGTLRFKVKIYFTDFYRNFKSF